jgi:hypothetical protein
MKTLQELKDDIEKSKDESENWQERSDLAQEKLAKQRIYEPEEDNGSSSSPGV